MDERRGLKILNAIMGWDEDKARSEFQWLRLMARVKYDGYRDFLAGMRFLESLAAWLQQFATQAEREAAYDLLRYRLIYIGPAEMQRLVELFFPVVIQRQLLKLVAASQGIPAYRIWANSEARESLRVLQRKTLILGLSDGARIDILRHATVGKLGNEQFAIQTQIDVGKWNDLLADLRRDLKSTDATFEVVYLVDDFMGTSSSFLRWDEEKKEWTGKLARFVKSLDSASGAGVSILAEGWKLHVHHYLATQRARERLNDSAPRAIEALGLAAQPTFSYGTIIPSSVCIDTTQASDEALVRLTQKYYNSNIETKHTDKGGVKHLGLGYGGCALPLVLEHNTPNNSLALLWAEIGAGKDKADVPQPEMRPLFRRRQRHT